MFDAILRKHIRQIRPYSSARDEYFGQAGVYLDANENPFDFRFNRYPDPYQRELKQKIARVKQINPANLFLGNGSDEIIDLLFRAFCEPYRDTVMAMSPSYGMYEVSAAINAVEVKKFILEENFTLDAELLINELRSDDKLVFLCTPNNPTGSVIDISSIKLIAQNFPGLVVVDEAYIDFSTTGSTIPLLAEQYNLVILQTFSKALASAGLRLGMGFMHADLVQILNTIKPPYNISQATQSEAMAILDSMDEIREAIRSIVAERNRMMPLLESYSFVRKVYESQANFVLVKVVDSNSLYSYLRDRGIIVRNRSKLPLCDSCLRITIGTPEENDILLGALNQYT